MPLIDGNVTRCDIRIPNELYEQIESLAIERKAKIHHRSGKPEVTSTILELIEIGLTYRHLSDNSSDKLSGNLSDEALDDLASKVYDKISDLRSDNLAVLSDLTDKISDIEDEMKKRPTQRDLDKALEPILREIAEIDRALEDFQTRRENSPNPTRKDKNNQSPQNPSNGLGTSEKPENALTALELAEKLGLRRQSLEEARDNGTLSKKYGYDPIKIGGRWFYVSLKEETNNN